MIYVSLTFWRNAINNSSVYTVEYKILNLNSRKMYFSRYNKPTDIFDNIYIFNHTQNNVLAMANKSFGRNMKKLFIL